MKSKLWSKQRTFIVVMTTLILGIALSVGAVLADTKATDFESFSLGSVNGQNGWSMTGPFDVEVVDASATYPAFGDRSLRISNAVTSGSFGDQTFSQSLNEEAGETDAENGGLSSGPRQEYFEAEWEFASAVPGSEQSGLSVVVSPDRGDGARMGWIQMADTPSGLEINFYGYDTSNGGTCSDLVNFEFANVASGLDRTIPHTIKVTMEFVDGINNDVVKVYVDGNLEHTGKSWEDFFRNCQPPGSRTVDSLLFRVSGTAAPATSGDGFFIDNVSLFSGAVPVPLCTTDCYVDAATGSDSNTGEMGDPFATIQKAIDTVDPNGTVHVADGTYNEAPDVDKVGVTIDGESKAGTIIDASSINDYSLEVTVDDVTLQDFTLIGNPAGTYGIKAAGPSPTRISNLTIMNVLVDNSKRTGVDLNGVDGALIKDVEVKDVPSGNGLAITDSNDVTFENITTSNNAWGGLAIYTFGRYFSLGSDNIEIKGTNSFGEDNKVYVQRGNFNDPGNPEPVTNLTVNGFAYTVMNDTFRAGGENFTFYQISQSDAINFALGLATPLDSYVNQISNGHFWVGDGMSIQAASDHAEDGDTINVLAGTFNEQVEITDNDISLLGAGPNDTLLVSTDPCTNQMNSSATAGVRLLGDHSGITLQGFSVSGYDLGLDIGENIGKTISDVTIEDVNASNNCVHGILSQAGDTDGVSINNVTANDNGSGFFAGRGIWMINGTKADISITNSEFNDNRLVGIDLSDGDVTGVNIVGNTVVGNGDSGIGVLGPQGPDNNLVEENTVTDNGRFGIEIKNPGGTTMVRDNDVSLTGPGSDTRDYAGIAVFRRSPGATNADQPSGVTVISNTVTGFVEPNGDGEGFGILVEGENMIVTENTVTGNDVGIQVQEGNPSPNTNGTPFFDRGDASVAADVLVNLNNIDGNGEGMRAVGVSSDVDGTRNWWGDASGPSGEGAGSGDSVSTDVIFCPWLDGSVPGGSPVGFSGGIATTSSDGHTTPYCTIEEAMFASVGANQEVHVTEGNWPGEVMTRDYSDSPNLLVKATGNRDNTIVNGMYLSGSSFDGLTFENFTLTGDAPSTGYDPGAIVELTNNGSYQDLAFVGNIFDGQNETDRQAIFLNRGFDGFLVDNNIFKNFEDSLARPDGGFIANYSLIFAEAQQNTSGNNYTITNNEFINIKHLNSIEAYRWKNVTIEKNSISGVHGRILVWNSGLDLPLQSVVIKDNDLDLSNGTDDYSTTGIGVYYVMADVNIIENEVDAANTCVTTIGVSDLELLDNELTNCAARGHYFSEPGAGVETTRAIIVGNTFDTSPVGVENFSADFKLDACDNTYIDIGTERAENPGPFVRCEGDLLVEKQIDWKGNDSFEAEFEVCVSGPSIDGEQCEMLADSESFTLTDLEPGDYTISETDAGDVWREPKDQTVEIVKDTLTEATVKNVYSPLRLTSVCSDDPSSELRWRVRNYTDEPLDYDWAIVDGPSGRPSGSDTAQPGDSFFFSPRHSGNNVMVLFVNDVEQVASRKASGYAICDYDVTVVKFEDIDNDGVQDDSEPTLEEWSFEVKKDNQVIDTVTTGEDGTATVEELTAGVEYEICEVEQDGWLVTTDACQTIVPSGEGSSNPVGDNTVRFGNFKVGQITLGKWADDNVDGRWQGDDEEGIADWEFSIQPLPDGDVDTKTTGPNGYARFKKLGPGTYRVCETVPEGWAYTGFTKTQRTDDVEPIIDGDTVCFEIVIDESGERADISFGNFEYGQITLGKWEDDNVDGRWQRDSETGVADWQFSIEPLTDGATEFDPATQTTGPNGFTSFRKLRSGTYRVCETVPTGWGYTGFTKTQRTDDVTEIIDGDTVCFEVVIDKSGERADISFGNYQLGTLTLIKDANPTADWLDWAFESELGSFTLNTSNSISKTQVFTNVAVGEYTITETSLAERGNWYLADVDCGPDADQVETDLENGSATITMEGSAESITCIFKNVRRGQIQITKYDDVDRNGERNDEAGISEWQMFLYEPDESSDSGWSQIQPREVRTNENGVANYTNLDMGTYLVCEEAVEGWNNSQPGNAAGEIIDGQICQEVEVNDSEVTPVTFGNYELAKLTVIKEATPAAPWLDWTFVISDDETTDIQFTLDNDETTDTAKASYSSYLEPGQYTVNETNLPGNWDLFASCEAVGDGGSSGSPNETDGVDAELVGGDELICTFENQRRPQIKITKYEDGDQNGSYSAEEDTLAEGWQMFLYEEDLSSDSGWTQIQPREVRTNENGVANYTNLEPGKDYRVCEENREGWLNSDPGEAAIDFEGLICQDVEDLLYGEVREVIFGNREATTQLTIVKQSSLTEPYEFTSTIPGYEQFSLTPNTENDRVTAMATSGTYTISEVVASFPKNVQFLGASCMDANANNAPVELDELSYDPPRIVVTVGVDQDVVCTFLNEPTTFEGEDEGEDEGEGEDEDEGEEDGGDVSEGGDHTLYLPLIVR